jgi:uncharacterized OsmC-like protein
MVGAEMHGDDGSQRGVARSPATCSAIAPPQVRGEQVCVSWTPTPIPEIAMTDEAQPSVTLRQQRAYQFDISFSPEMPQLLADEPSPLGQGAGPSPAQLLLAAVGNCMSSSLYFALTKFKNDPGGITTTASAEIGRNPAGRLRVLHIAVDIRMGAAAASLNHLERTLDQFEQFCTVGESVRGGIPTTVSVYDGAGRQLK